MNADGITGYAYYDGIERGEFFDVIAKTLAFLSAAWGVVFGVKIDNQAFALIIA
jgi:hypothetical protein